MYAGKQVHLPVLYSPEHDHYSPERLLLIGELKRAIEQDELVVHYQPVVDVAYGSVKGFEALVRWQHPGAGAGLARAVRRLRRADRADGAAHRGRAADRAAPVRCVARRTGTTSFIAVNVSGRDLGDRGFPARVASLLADAGLEAEALELEITEDTLLADPVRTLTVLDNLREVGVRLAVDDFGAGRTSLHYLRKLRVDALKIDRSFVLDLLGDTDNQAIVRSTVELAHRLGLSVVAEGVETADTLDLLAGYGCDLAQGHLFSRPVPADELEPRRALVRQPPLGRKRCQTPSVSDTYVEAQPPLEVGSACQTPSVSDTFCRSSAAARGSKRRRPRATAAGRCRA